MPPRHRFRRFVLDTLLIPIAVLIVVIEDVLWAGALALLHRINDLGPVRALRVQVERLPASIALPLFLVPEVVSHVAGAYATLLLAQGRIVAAILVGVLIKGTSMLVMVWIYQSCEETLLRVPWFARLHHWAMAVRDWALAQVGPIRARLRAALAGLQHWVQGWLAPYRQDMRGRPLHLRSRLLAWRARFSVWIRRFSRR